MKLNLQALQEGTPALDGEIAAAYIAAAAQLKTQEVELAILKQLLIDATHDQWVRENTDQPTASVVFEDIGGNDLLVGRRRKTSLYTAIPEGAEAHFDESFTVTVDGSKISPAKRQAALDALAEAGIPAKAIKAKAGYKLRDGALTAALQDGDDVTVAFVEGCYTNTITIK